MNKKNIQILVVVICFAGAGYVLYNGFFASSTPSAALTPAPTLSNSGPDKILPTGDTFDVDKVFSPYNFQFGAYTYPVVNTTTDIGVDVNSVVKPELGSDSGSPIKK